MPISYPHPLIRPCAFRNRLKIYCPRDPLDRKLCCRGAGNPVCIVLAPTNFNRFKSTLQPHKSTSPHKPMLKDRGKQDGKE